MLPETNENRILMVLQKWPGLDDDTLSTRAGVSPRQQVNQICRRLEKRGLIRRAIGPQGKIVNHLTETGAAGVTPHSHASPASVLTKRQPVAPPPATDDRISFVANETLILLPCSGEKNPGGSSSAVGCSVTADLSKELAGRLEMARRDNLQTRLKDSSLMLPAWQRYRGSLYKAAGSRIKSALDCGAHILIISGGYGLVRSEEPIADYDAVFQRRDWPQGLLESVLLAYVRKHDIRRVVAFASATTGYANLIRATEWRSTQVQEAILLTPERTTGAMKKSPRAQGEALVAFFSNKLRDGFRSSDGLSLLIERIYATDGI